MSNQKNKRTATPWLHCEKCSIYILDKDRESHSNDCPLKSPSYSYVQDETLHSVLDLKTNEEIKGVVDKDNLVFLSQSVIQLCSLAIGEWAVIKLKDKPPVAKIVWPTTEKTLTSVLFTKLGAELSSVTVGLQVVVSKLPQFIPEAKRVSLVLLNGPKSLKLTPDLNNRIHKGQIGKYFCVGNKIGMMYFGKVLKFEIKFIEREGELEDAFERLSMEEGALFRTTEATHWRLHNNETEFESEANSRPSITQIGGLNEEIAEIQEIINASLEESKLSYGLNYSRSLLIHGSPGTGKTLLALAIAEESNFHATYISASDLYSKYTENPETTLKNLFEEAQKRAPSIIILDEVDILCPTRNSRTSDSEKRLVSTLLNLLDGLDKKFRVFILGITSKLENIDPVFRRYGRFDREIEIPTPSPKNRKEIIARLLNANFVDLTEADLNEIALNTHGFVGADLASLCSRAALIASKHNVAKLTLQEFNSAMKFVRPSAMREVQVEVANVKWGDIGGQENLKLMLRQAVEWPLKYPASFIRLGITPPKGVLMFGPPGCSKTMVAKALATESGLNFLSIKGPELFSKWVGESEKAVRKVFQKARQVSPCIIFFDEIDALGGERSSGANASVQERVLAQLLTELDGVTPLEDVTVLAATNRPDRIDKALLRPGRLDRIVYVPLPDEGTRREIFRIKLRKMPVMVTDVDVEILVASTSGYSGAEVNAVCHEAAMTALEENIDAQLVKFEHFEKALKLVSPRTPPDLVKLYENYVRK